MAQTYTKEKIDELIAEAEGTEVIANPTLAGTESALTGLQVGDTKYKIEASGGNLYCHNLAIIATNDAYSARFVFIDTSSSPLNTQALLSSYLLSKGVVSYSTSMSGTLNGYKYDPINKTATFIPVIRLYRTSASDDRLVISGTGYIISVQDGALTSTNTSGVTFGSINYISDFVTPL